MLTLTDLTKTYRLGNDTVQALDHTSLTAKPGDFLAIRGASGSGKTTLLLITGALLQPDSGQVDILGTNPYTLPPENRAAFRAQHIGFVFQDCYLLNYLNIHDNILAPALAKPDPAAPDRAAQLITQLGLDHRINHTPAELSAGERQRVALARALLNQPKIILADEPTGNLDEKNAQIVLNTFAQYTAQGNIVLLVTHHAEIAERAHRTLTMAAGRLTDPAASKT